MGVLNIFKYFDIRYIGKKVLGETNAKEKAMKIAPYIKEQSQIFIQGCHDAREKLKDIPGTNYRLGISHMYRGNLSDAILRFRMVSFLTPENPDAHYNLGRCFVMIGENDNAKKQFEKTLEMNKAYSDAKYQLAKLESPEIITKIPASIIFEKCEFLAENYSEEEASEDLDTGIALANFALSNIEDKNPNIELLDLGCGTGVCGEMLFSKNVTKNILGVDASPTMIKTLKKLKIDNENVYNSLENKEISEFLANNNKTFDLIISDDAMLYFGELATIVKLLKKSLSANGLVSFTINKSDTNKDFKIDIASDRFYHSNKYINDIFTRAGFEKIGEKELKINPENPKNAYIFRKK